MTANPPTKPFKVYQASAGAGKTYTIVKEYLALCLKDEASTSKYSNILAITFTNKAANEMKEKIMAYLDSIINSDIKEDPKDMEADLIKLLDIERNTLKTNAKLLFHKIIHDYSDFCVSTIDSFFQKVAHSFAKDLRLPSQFNVSIDEDEVADAITERISEQIGASNPFLTKILEDYCEMKFESENKPHIAENIHAFIKELFKEDSFQKNEKNHFETEEQYNETFSFLMSYFNSFESECQKFAKQFDAFISEHGLTVNDFKGKSKSPCLSLLNKVKDKNYTLLTATQEGLLDGKSTWYADNKLQSLDPEFAFFFDFLRKYRDRISTYLFYKYQQKSLSFYVLRSKIRSEIEAYIGEEMVVHISEFNKRINDILGDFSVPFIYERMGEHFRHIFIDEFQDTSILQWQNIIPLIDNNLSDNKLNMIVGDGKQSIYRWRNGEVGQIVSLPKIYEKPDDSPVFDTIEHNFINNFSFDDLKTNYRSFANIVHFNNELFAYGSDKFLPNDVKKVYSDEDEVFNKHLGTKQNIKKEAKGLVQVELFSPDEPPEEAMLKRTYEIIEELLGHGFRKGDITILVRKNKHGSLTAKYLHEKGIEVISPEAILLKTSARVQLIVNTLDYLIHPNNKVVIANVLYHWQVTHTKDFTGSLDHIFQQVGDIANGDHSIEEEMKLSPHQFNVLLDHAYSLYDLCAALIRLYGFNTIGDAFLNFLLDVVYKWQSADEYGIEHFLDYWEKKKNALFIITNDTDAVNIMTIHKSKGLEFPVVICPFVSDDIDKARTSTLWYTAEELGFRPIPNIAKLQFSFSQKRQQWSSQIKQLGERESERVRLDHMNLDYVAFTRAIQRLYILTQKSKDTTKFPINDFIQNENASSFMMRVENTDGSEWPEIRRFGGPEQGKVDEKKNKKANTNEIFHDSASSDWFNKISIDPNPSMFWMTEDNSFKPQEWGILVHKILSEVEHPEDLKIVLQSYADAGVIDEETTKMLERVFQMIVGHPDLSEAFSPQAKVKNECELLIKNETKRPDRYAELPDKIYLLDYKTGQPKEEDKKQLQEYRDIIKTLTDKEIKSFLVYIKPDHITIQQ